MTTELVILAIALGLIALWFGLLYTGIVPEKYRRITLGVVGIIATLGLLPLVRAIGQRRARGVGPRPAPELPPEPVTEAEVDDLDKQIEETIDEARTALEELKDVDAREAASRELADNDPDAGSIARERLRRLRERSK